MSTIMMMTRLQVVIVRNGYHCTTVDQVGARSFEGRFFEWGTLQGPVLTANVNGERCSAVDAIHQAQSDAEQAQRDAFKQAMAKCKAMDNREAKAIVASFNVFFTQNEALRHMEAVQKAQMKEAEEAGREQADIAAELAMEASHRQL